MLDLIIRGGLVIDGTGAPGAVADVGVQNGQIDAIGDLREAASADEVNAAGLVVAPGFIDAHDHSDALLLADPRHLAKLAQGVTTEVITQDGLSFAPLSTENLRHFRRYLAGVYGNPDLDWSWSTMAEYRKRFDRTVAVNTVFLVPHSAIRAEVVGTGDVPLIGASLQDAVRLVERALAEGAVGLSTGLSYFPGSYADTTELVELSKPVAEAGGVYVTHIRTVFRDKPFDPVLEALEIGQRSGAAVHFSHFRTDQFSAGHADALMAPIDGAYKAGQDVSLDTYPYSFGQGFAYMVLPPWVHAGSLTEILDRLADVKSRAKMIVDMEAVRRSLPNTNYNRLISHVPSQANRDLIGMTFSEAVSFRGKASLVDMLCDLLIDEDLDVAVLNIPPPPEIVEQIESDVFGLFSRCYCMVGSDAIYVGDRPHPRTHGTFPRLMGRFRRKYGTLSLETLVNRATAVPAARFRLRDRGTLARKMAADIVVFDSDQLSDHATLESPQQMATGVRHVIVNGVPALRDGISTGAMAGRPLP